MPYDLAMWCIAHRGGAALWPENTLAAFRDAVARGCDGAELDVQLSRDGQVVVFHDYRLKPEICRDEHGAWLVRPTPRIKDLTLEELRRFDIGRPDPATPYARQHPLLEPADRERIPTLAQVIDVTKTAAKPFHLFVELKTSFADRNLSADPKELAEATLRILLAHDYVDRTVLVGFDWQGLLHTKAIEPQIQCWFTTQPQSWFADALPPAEDEPPSAPALQMLRHWASTGTSPWAAGYDAVNYGGSILSAIREAGGDGWFPMYRDVTPEMMAEARGLGLKVGAWSVDDTQDMRAMIDRDLDALCTDRPDLLLALASAA
jgi:glycerophosphoryl diester phosphodiesterase